MSVTSLPRSASISYPILQKWTWKQRVATRAGEGALWFR